MRESAADRLLAPVWVIAVVAVLGCLRVAAELVIPIVVAILVSYALEPLVAWLVGRRLPRLLAAAVVTFGLVGGLGGIAYDARTRLASVADTLPRTIARVQHTVAESLAAAGLESVAEGPGTPAPENLQRLAGSLVALAGHATVVVFLVFFLLAAGQRLGARLVEAAGPDAEPKARMARIIADVNAQVERFLFVQLVTATIVGVLTWGALVWQGVDNAALWAGGAGLFNTIPYFGPFVVSSALFLVGLVQSGDPSLGVRLALIALAITSIEGWLITPPLMGRAERMNVLAVFVGVLVWTWLWGAWGTLLAVPMLSMVKAVADHVPAMRRIGRLMAA